MSLAIAILASCIVLLAIFSRPDYEEITNLDDFSSGGKFLLLILSALCFCAFFLMGFLSIIAATSVFIVIRNDLFFEQETD